MIDLAALESCSDLTSEHAKQAASSSTEIRILLKRVAQIAKPGEGCPKVLMAIARLVGQEWVEGDLRIELSGDEVSTTLIVMCDYGVGIRERLLPATRFEVPLDEFERALELAPKLVLPLRITDEGGKLVLTPLLTPEAHVHSVAPPEVALDSTSLGDNERTTAPPPADELLPVDEASPEDLEMLAPVEIGNEAKTAPPPAGASEGESDGDGVHAAYAPRMESGPVPSGNPPEVPPEHEGRISNIHTRPTVRRMVAVDAAAIAGIKRRDPRREEE